jgi:hypothetical protein
VVFHFGFVAGNDSQAQKIITSKYSDKFDDNKKFADGV